jgi:hypothetical protein
MVNSRGFMAGLFQLINLLSDISEGEVMRNWKSTALLHKISRVIIEISRSRVPQATLAHAIEVLAFQARVKSMSTLLHYVWQPLLLFLLVLALMCTYLPTWLV